jgi:alginate biosynthesis protein Alg44
MSNAIVSSDLITSKISHQTVDERQHVRAKIPALITLQNSDGNNLTANVTDISLGGIGFEYGEELPLGILMHGSIKLRIQGAEISIETHIKIISQHETMIGAQFVDMDRQKIELLRHLIMATISGEITDIGGLIHVLQREHHIYQRKTTETFTRSLTERLSAVSGTLIFLLIGIAALALIIYHGYMLAYRIPAATGSVSGNIYTLIMPESGNLKYLIDEQRKTIQTGEPLANVSTRLANSLAGIKTIQNTPTLSEQDAQDLLSSVSIDTVINSPCNCEIYYPNGRLDGFYYRETPVIELIPIDEPLFIKASVPYSELSDINKIQTVELTVFGVSEKIHGTLIRARLNENTQHIDLELQPTKELPRNSYHNPVSVDIYLAPPFSKYFQL